MKIDNLRPATFGLFQVAVEIVYVALVVLFMSWFSKMLPTPNEFAGGAVMIFLFTFSAAVMGLLVFGYPVYLFIKQQFARAVWILSYNFLFSLIAILAAATAIRLVY